MKNGFIKIIRVLAVIFLVLNIVSTVGLLFLGDFWITKHVPGGTWGSSLQILLEEWKAAPFDFGNSDIMFLYSSILFFIIPICILVLVKPTKEGKHSK